MSWLDKAKVGASGAKRSTRKLQGRAPGANSRAVTYSTSPLLASKTPPWRSKFLVAVVGVAFCGLLGRAL